MRYGTRDRGWNRERCVCVCARVHVCTDGRLVPEEVDANVEFGGPYINQFHYHRDQGVLEFQLRATL